MLLLAAVGVVLLIACANVANLLLARSVSRRREMAVRMALGAGRSDLVSQLLSESLALALVAGVAGLAIANWGARALVALIPDSVTAPGLADVRINGWVLAFALGVTVATAIASGLVSALTVPTANASAALATSARVSAGRSTRRAASALVVGEVALAIVLFAGAGLLLRSFVRLLAVDPGFRTDRVMTLHVAMPADRYRAPDASRAFFDRAFAALKSVADVEEVGAAVVTPLTGNNWTIGFERVEQPAPPGERPPEVGWQLASGGYFKTLKIPLLSGRLFNAEDRPSGQPVVIVSQAIERRYFPNDSAVGRQIKLGDDKAEIVGVVGALFVRTRSDPQRALPALQVTHLALWLLGIFAAIALALAAVGIYGVMSYVVRQRTREIGMRVALDATKGDIVWLVMREGAGIATAGATIGVAAGLFAARALASILYGTSQSDPGTFAAAAAVLTVTAIAACYLPARRAASVDPARSLAESQP